MSETPQSAGTRKIHADPTKDFFVKMITRDIELNDCIFDLLDNAIDGARRAPNDNSESPLCGYYAHISFDDEKFSIEDNCGGIRLSDAIDYAFHFGRRPNSPSDVDGGIGLYGIGMKRAIFKIGALARIVSHAEDASFEVTLNVHEWEKKSDWDFEYGDVPKSENKGTKIQVHNLNAGIETSFTDLVFKNELIRLIARDYAFFIAKGFSIRVNDTPIPSYSYQLRENENLVPASTSYEDSGVRVRIVAGLIDDLPDEIPDELSPKDVERYGWYVICNDRIVLAADKTSDTIWGDGGFPTWHPQYNGFAGFLFFQADDQALLPWTTTKRDVDKSNPLYKRTKERLKNITIDFTRYTNQRKANLEAARTAEKPATQRNVYADIKSSPPQTSMKLPVFEPRSPSDPFVNIAYKRRESEIQEVRSYLKRQSMTYRDIGIHTFEYFMEMELGK